MKKSFLIFLCLFIQGTTVLFSYGIQEMQKRIDLHLLVGDEVSALQEAKKAICLEPQNEEIQKAYVRVLAISGKEGEAADCLKKFFCGKKKLPRDLLEEISWGVLEKGMSSTQYSIRWGTLLGAYFTQDARAVKMLLKAMEDSNLMIQSMGIRLSCDYRDHCLQEVILKKLFEKKSDWQIRKEAIVAVGRMKMKEAREKLREILKDEKSSFEEKALVIQALVQMSEEMSDEELFLLFRSPHSGFRSLACELAVHFEKTSVACEVLKLFRDPIAEVRLSALNAWGVFYRKEEPDQVKKKYLGKILHDVDPIVSITGAWLGLLLQDERGSLYMKRWLKSESLEYRRLAAAALGSAGSYGTALALETFGKQKDPYIRVNLALSLLGQKISLKKCCDEIFSFFKKKKELWMWGPCQNPLFSALLPSQIEHQVIPQYPEMVDLSVTLQLLSRLAIGEDVRAEEGIRHFLKNKCFGIPAFAAEMLLEEGNEKSREILSDLLKDEEISVRFQAAWVLAVIGKDTSAIPILQESYAKADHEMKLRILEALGLVGKEESFSFFLGGMKEPFPMLKIVAASSMIQSLNR